MCCSTPAAAKGFREGGNNIALPAGPPPIGCDQDLANLGVTAASVAAFKSDNLWNYEAGFKSSFADRRFTLNGAASPSIGTRSSRPFTCRCAATATRATQVARAAPASSSNSAGGCCPS